MPEETAILQAILRAPLQEFTTRRAELVKALRAQGDAELARRIAALRKPSLVVWALDQAGAVAADDLAELRRAGTALSDVQQALLQGAPAASTELQRAVAAQRRAVDTVTRRLGMVLTAAGHAAADATLRRIADALRSLSIADDATWTSLQDGVLLVEPDAATFPVLDVGDAAPVERRRDEIDNADRQRRVDAAAADLRRAEDAERSALEQERDARKRREQAAADVERARRALAALQSRS